MRELEQRYESLRKMGLDQEAIDKIRRMDSMIVAKVKALCVELGYGAVAQTAEMLERECRESLAGDAAIAAAERGEKP